VPKLPIMAMGINTSIKLWSMVLIFSFLFI